MLGAVLKGYLVYWFQFFLKLLVNFVLFRTTMWTALETEFLCLQREHLNPDGRFITSFITFHVLQLDWRQTSALCCLFYTFAAPSELPPNVFLTRAMQAASCGVNLEKKTKTAKLLSTSEPLLFFFLA